MEKVISKKEFEEIYRAKGLRGVMNAYNISSGYANALRIRMGIKANNKKFKLVIVE